MAFNSWAILINVYCIDIINKKNRMRVSHTDTCCLECCVDYIKVAVYKLFCICNHWNFRNLECGFSHIDLEKYRLAVFNSYFYCFDSGLCFNSHCILFNNLVSVNKITEATNTVSTHFSFRSVWIKHPVSYVSHFRWNNKQYSISTYSKVSMA